jgi:hypothetical protein
MPGTTFITSAARLAVSLTVVLDHDAAHALRLGEGGDVDVVHVAAEHVRDGVHVHVDDAGGRLTLGGGAGKPPGRRPGRRRNANPTARNFFHSKIISGSVRECWIFCCAVRQSFDGSGAPAFRLTSA